MRTNTSIISQGLPSFSDYDKLDQEFRMKKQAALDDAAYKKATLDLAQKKLAAEASYGPDVGKLGESAFLKIAQGLPVSPQELAAARFVDAKSGGVSFNPVTGETIQKPRISDKIGLPGMMQAQQAEEGNYSIPPVTEEQLFAAVPNAENPFPPPPSGYSPTRPGLNPRAMQKMTETGITADRERLKDITEKAQAGQASVAQAQQALSVLPRLGHTGFGGEALGWSDKALSAIGLPDVVSGDPSAREAFQKLSVGEWVNATTPLKGALSDKEGERIASAVPSLRTTPEGIKTLAELVKATGERAQQMSQFYQQYFDTNGTLSGADKMWKDYVDANPIVPENFGAGSSDATDIDALVERYSR